MITGRLTIAVEYLEVHQMDMRRMSLPPWTFLIDEAPDLDIPKARLRLRAFRVESVTVNRPVDRWKVVLQLGAGTEGECPSPDGCLGSKSLDHAQAVGQLVPIRNSRTGNVETHDLSKRSLFLGVAKDNRVARGVCREIDHDLDTLRHRHRDAHYFDRPSHQSAIGRNLYDGQCGTEGKSEGRGIGGVQNAEAIAASLHLQNGPWRAVYKNDVALRPCVPVRVVLKRAVVVKLPHAEH